jgi:hypothetical protein
VDGVAKMTGARFELNSMEFTKGTHFIWVTASDGVKSVQSPAWQTLVTAIELATFEAMAEPYKGVTVSWSTTQELNNMGFDVLRGVNSNGPFQKINPDLIPAREDGRYVYVDTLAAPGERYYYTLEDVSKNGLRTKHGPIAVTWNLPDNFSLEQNYPNPFNPTTRIRFQLPRAEKVKLLIYNLMGQQIRTLVDGKLNAGYYELTWDGCDDLGQRVGSGVYYYRLSAPVFHGTKKMLLVK